MRKHRTTPNQLLIAALWICGTFVVSGAVSAPAEASVVDWITTVSAQQPNGGETKIVVASDGNSYTQVIDGRVDLWAKSYGLCKKPSRWARSALYIVRKSGGQWEVNDDWNTGLQNDQSIEHTTHKVVDLNAAERQAVITACNQNLTAKMNQGMTRRAVLAKDQILWQPHLFEVKHNFWCDGHLLNADFEVAKRNMYTPITCKAYDFPSRPDVSGPGNLATHFQVTSAALDVDPEQSSAVTKAHLTVSGEIGANRAGDVKIRVSHNGRVGPLSTIHFDAAGKEQFSFPLTIPCPSGGSSGSGGVGGGGGGGINNLAGNPSNVIGGHLEFRVVSPPSPVKKSNKTFYSVTCRPTPTVAPKMPDLVVELVQGTATPLLARVSNVGSAPSAATQLEVRFPKSTQHLPVPPIGVGKMAEIPVAYPPGAGSDEEFGSTEVIVDRPPVVSELNENNNSSGKKG